MNTEDKKNYRYAIDGAGKRVHIDDITRENRDSSGPFKCLNCGHQMTSALGEVNAHHFKHVPGEYHCSFEEYERKLDAKTEPQEKVATVNPVPTSALTRSHQPSPQQQPKQHEAAVVPRTMPKVATYTPDDAPSYLSIFVGLYTNGKVGVAVGVSERDFEWYTQDPYLLHYEFRPLHFAVKIDEQKLFLETLKAQTVDLYYNRGLPVRACLICAHSGRKIDQRRIECVRKPTAVDMPSGAVGCRSYMPVTSSGEAQLKISESGF